MHCVNEWVQLEPVSAALEHFWAHSFRWTLLRFEPLLSAYHFVRCGISISVAVFSPFKNEPIFRFISFFLS